MASEATPRINANYLEKFTNQTVRVIGKVTSLRGDMATIDAKGSVNIILNRVCTLMLAIDAWPAAPGHGSTGAVVELISSLSRTHICKWAMQQRSLEKCRMI